MQTASLVRALARHFRSNLVAYVALFFALSGGVAWALKANSVKSKQIKNGQVHEVDLGAGAVTEGKLANGAVGNAKIVDGAVNGAKVADNSITGAKVDESSLALPPDHDSRILSNSVTTPNFPNTDPPVVLLAFPGLGQLQASNCNTGGPLGQIHYKNDSGGTTLVGFDANFVANSGGPFQTVGNNVVINISTAAGSAAAQGFVLTKAGGELYRVTTTMVMSGSTCKFTALATRTG
jgi:hypothetical protein